MSITNFAELVKAAGNKAGQHKLLFLFARAKKMEDARIKSSHHSGTIVPVMCVDKDPSELTSFAALVREADSLTSEWDFILIGALAGKDGSPPNDQEVDAQLHKMSNNLASGGDLSSYVILDRSESPIIIC